ncbi:MAG: trehalose-phosphatase, partial [Elusimicrobia bacterium]|nr:trehalose-phosphatase [Elusimicrobiota bacterium]MBD3412547.1 trehalose-phosphatase [Elusimicrobiota bacterium]
MNKTIKSVIFDLDGVITKTALVHARAWKQVFDEYMRLREKRNGEPFKEFADPNDYLTYVDGKPRYKGVQSFLESRGITIPYGDPSDTPDTETICGVGNKKNEKFRNVLAHEGVQVYESTIAFIKKLKGSMIRVGVASSSKNCRTVLQSAGIENLFETRVDGEVSAELGLTGKPEPDIFVTAALNLGAEPAESVVVEDAVSGVQAGRNGGFGLVLGIAREDNMDDLLKYGADIVVNDMAAISLEALNTWFEKKPRLFFDQWHTAQPDDYITKLNDNPAVCRAHPGTTRSSSAALLNGRQLIFFLDYDGTLTPIVDRPEDAVMADDMRAVVRHLSQKCMVAVVSGRQREDVEQLVHINGLYYAGSHGFDIRGQDFAMIQPKAQEVIPVVTRIIEELKHKLSSINGVLIEEKKFSVAVHYRLADKKHLPEITAVVNEINKK